MEIAEEQGARRGGFETRPAGSAEQGEGKRQRQEKETQEWFSLITIPDGAGPETLRFSQSDSRRIRDDNPLKVSFRAWREESFLSQSTCGSK